MPEILDINLKLPHFKMKGGSYFEKKTLNDYSSEVKNVFNKLTISGKYRVIGSNSLKSIKYGSDYDLEELDKESGKHPLKKIYDIFKKKYEDGKRNENIFITDFKCGLNSNGEPLRWNYNQIQKGKQELENGRMISFEECLLIKTTMKLDMIVLIDGIFTEFSENYYLDIGGKKNYFEHDANTKYIITSIQKDIDFYLNVDRNYWKTLKRLFSVNFLKKKNYPLLKELIDFFNSKIGLVNKCKNELDILLIVLDNNFRKPKISDIKYNLDIVNKWGKKADLNLDQKINKIKSDNLSSLYKDIEKLKDELFKIVNNYSFKFLQNKNLI